MKISDMELFLGVLGEKSLNRAADKYFITEAALSQQLRKMEKELSCTLFYRQKGKKMELTQDGEAFKMTCEAIVQEYHAFLQSRKKERKGPLRIGVSIRQSAAALEALKMLKEHFSPEKQVLIETGYEERQKMLEAGQLDLAFTSLPLEGRGLDCVIIRRQPMGIFLRKGHPARKTAVYRDKEPYPYISLDVLKNEPLLLPGQSMSHQRQLVLKILKDHQITPDIVGDFQTLSYGAVMAEAGSCSSISVLFDDNGKYRDNFFRISGCSVTYDRVLAFRRENAHDPQIQEIIRCFRQYFDQSGK